MECDLSSLSPIVIGGLILKEGIEYWLGKTDKVKAGSVLEMVVNLVLSGLKAFVGKKEEPKV
jgi:hypothetical protein